MHKKGLKKGTGMSNAAIIYQSTILRWRHNKSICTISENRYGIHLKRIGVISRLILRAM